MFKTQSNTFKTWRLFSGFSAVLVDVYRATYLDPHCGFAYLNRHSRISHVGPSLHRNQTGVWLAAPVIDIEADLGQPVTPKNEAFGHFYRLSVEAVKSDGLGFGLYFDADRGRLLAVCWGENNINHKLQWF